MLKREDWQKETGFWLKSMVFGSILFFFLIPILYVTRWTVNMEYVWYSYVIAGTIALTSMVVGLLADKLEWERGQIRVSKDGADVDQVTNLFSYRYFQKYLFAELKKAENSNSQMALLMLDIDDFKHYNDFLGFQKGDVVLDEMGQIIRSVFSRRCIATRYRGGKFCVFLQGLIKDKVYSLADKLRQAVQEYPFEGYEYQPSGRITISIGIAFYPENGTTATDLIRLADEALYKAKYNNKNRVEIYTSIFKALQQEMNPSVNDTVMLTAVNTLFSIINARDRYTLRHCEKVAEYAVALAHKMNLEPYQIEEIRIGALLHDLGKIEIPKEILNKKGKLSEEEWEIIKQHVNIAEDIIKSISYLKDLVPMVKYHHERFDGKGYPDGLKGLDIPLGARILAVADSYDAMRSNRPYRRGMSLEDAVAEIRRCAATQFDPEIVEHFLDLAGSLEGPQYAVSMIPATE